MRSMISGLLLLTGLCLLSGRPTHVAAQQQQPPKKPVLDNLVTKATLVGIQGDLCKITVVGNPWLLKIDPKVEVDITGTAEPDFLALMQQPLMVRFKAEFNTRTKQSTAAVTELEILNLGEKDKAGIVDEGTNAFDTQKKGPPPMTANVTVTGPVSGYKNGVLTVVGLKAAIDPAAKITVKITEPKMLLMLPVGTEFEADFDYPTMTQGKGLLKKAKVALAEPLAPPKKPTPNAGKRGNAAKEPATKGKSKAEDAPQEPSAKPVENGK